MSAPNLALVAVVHGRACVLHMDADEGITDYVEDLGPDAMSDFKWPSDGVWVCELRMVDAGESDWPGEREYALGDPVHMRAPTAVEWGRHLDEEHLWRTAEQVASEPVVASVEDVLGFKIRPTPTITEDTKITVFHGPPVPADPPRE